MFITHQPKKSKSKKKKKKPPVLDSAPATPLPSTKSHPKGGSSKVPVIDGGMDEIDRALAELGMDKPRIIANEATRESDPIWEAVRDLFVIDPKNLDSDAELRRFFGAKVVSRCHSLHPAPSIESLRVLTQAYFVMNQFRLTKLRSRPFDRVIMLDSPTIPITLPPLDGLHHTLLIQSLDGRL